MIRHTKSSMKLSKTAIILLLFCTAFSCRQENKTNDRIEKEVAKSQKPAYFLLRPELEKMYGYTQAVRIGNLIKIGGVVSIDEKGKPMAKDDFLRQMKNCYGSLEKVLKNYGCTFDDVVVENLYTTRMSELHKYASYRKEIYKNHFPTGSWIGIKELGLPELMIEIEIEALIPET